LEKGGQVEERMGDAGVGPVEEDRSPSAGGDVAGVQVAVDQRVRDAAVGELPDRRTGDTGHGVQPVLIRRGKEGEQIVVGEQRIELELQAIERPGEAAEAGKLAFPPDVGALVAGVQAQCLLPGIHVGASAGHGAEVRRQNPDLIWPGRQQTRQVVGEAAGQPGEQGRLVREQDAPRLSMAGERRGAIEGGRLEVDRAAVGL
jgi:hypothetical protein